MENSSISDRLRALAKNAEGRPTIAKMRDVIDDIEAALAAGVKRSDILDELLKQGIKMTLSTFDSNLHRIRRKRGTSTHRQTFNTQESSGNDLPSEQSGGGATSGSEKPVDIGEIMRSTPDLNALAKAAKLARLRRNKS